MTRVFFDRSLHQTTSLSYKKLNTNYLVYKTQSDFSLPPIMSWIKTCHTIPQFAGLNFVTVFLFICTIISWTRVRKRYDEARTVTDMDGTLHTDLGKSETSREIKKIILVSFEHLQKLHWFSKLGWWGSKTKLATPILVLMYIIRQFEVESSPFGFK